MPARMLRLFPAPRPLVVFVFAFAQLLGLAALAQASSNSDARLAIHLLPRTTKNACTRAEAAPACASIVTNGGLYPNLYYGYLLVTNGDPGPGLAGLQCGISYDSAVHSGVDMYTWSLCATLEFPSGGWPASGSGNLITWDSTTRCQRNEPGGPGMGVVATAGYFYLAAYSSDVLQLTVRPVDGTAKVADCANAESILEGAGVHHVPAVLGSASFSAGGGSSGYNPCDPNPVAIDCSISGPDTVVVNSGSHAYSAPLAPPGAGYAWSVSGGGSIVGASTGPSVDVVPSSVGAYTVLVTVSTSTSSSSCSKRVTVQLPAPTCTIAGPLQVASRTPGLTFDVSVTPAGSLSGVDWTISGQGTITGGAHSTRVTVSSGEAGAFELTATVHTFGTSLPGHCATTVTVVEPSTSCTLLGPDPVLTGATGLTYSVVPGAGTITTVDWTIMGDGTITSDPSLTSITVQAGAVGAFEVTATIRTTASILPGTCRRTVTVAASVPVTCAIAGPATVSTGVSGYDYSVSASGPITGVEWAISGQGTISSGTNNVLVSVTAGAPGAFDLTATVHTSNSDSPGSCTVTVTVLEPTIACTIDGPAAATTGDIGLSYAVSIPAGTITDVAWTITGNGTLTSSPNVSPVTVRADAVGAFELTATIHSNPGGATGICRRVVTVSDPVTPTCSILGPASVVEGSLDSQYEVVPSGPYGSVSWSITGNGTITSSLTATTIHVQAGEVGAFEVTATLHGPGPESRFCRKAVTVTMATCSIAGPDPVITRGTGLIYTTGDAIAGATYRWQLSGNATFAAGTQSEFVIVNATTPGAFTLSVTITRNGTPTTCSRTITVIAGSGGAHTQANAKLMIHLTPRTAKNECGSRGAPACSQIVTRGALYPDNYFAYLVVGDGDALTGIGGLQCGITYDPAPHTGVDVFSWTLCATLEFPSDGPNGSWPAAGSGNLITWDPAYRCQRTQPGGFGVYAAAGYFYCAAYSADRLQVTPRPVDGQAKVADCAASESLIGGLGYPPGAVSHLGYANFSANGFAPGYNPCGSASPVRVTTWSTIKALYAEPGRHSN